MLGFSCRVAAGAFLSVIVSQGAARAEAPPVFDQFREASRYFSPATGGPGDISWITDGIEGRWFPIGLVASATANPELYAGVCKGNGIGITVPNAWTIDTVTAEETDTPLLKRYTLIGDNIFRSHVDPEAMARQLGVDINEDLLTRLTLLRQQGGEVRIFRPSPDILVLLGDDGTEYLGRCAG